MAPDRYVLRVLAVLAAIRTATERAQRLIVERNILSEAVVRPSARQMADAAKMATSTLTRWAARPLQETTVDSTLDEPHVTRDRVSSKNKGADHLPLPEWLAHRGMLANAALERTPTSHLGPAARILLAGQSENSAADAATPQQIVRAFLTERAREAMSTPDLDLIASTPAGFAYGPDGSVTEFQHRELTVSALQALLSENDALRAQMGLPATADRHDISSEGPDFSPGEMVLYGLIDQPQNRYSAAEIAMMDEQAAIADEEAAVQSRFGSTFLELHLGRSFGTRRHIEDACPCPQEPCGLIAMSRISLDCEQHEFRQTFRQSHTPAQCAAVTAAQQRRERDALRSRRRISGADKNPPPTAARP